LTLIDVGLFTMPAPELGGTIGSRSRGLAADCLSATASAR
jgi:hypothetical protein